MMALYEEFEPQPNRLIDAESAYLRSAAYQPVGWYEFVPEAFEEARNQDKPILLDIGAAWCHWCHVIDRESYENPEIATFLNELYIPIKVDRDERPDIDARYQTAVQLLTGQGGWPLTVFLTPDGKPFYGGTYFPPEDRYGRVGLKTLLPRLAETYKNRREELDHAARALTERTRHANVGMTGTQPLTEEAFEEIAQGVRGRFNQEAGGFEHSAPKFPHPQAIELALLQWYRTGDAHWRAIVEKTLTAMGRGGIYDQLGGGFHRYSTDAAWIVPHFEKMGYDNALLLQNYLHAYRAFGHEGYREIAEGTLNYLLQYFIDVERGGCYTAQDADNSLQDDGSYWTWSFAEFVEPLLPEEIPAMTRYYGVTRGGNMPETGRNVLHVATTIAGIAAQQHITEEQVRARIDSGAKKLLEIRRHRKMPRIDENKYAGWNGLLASALLEAGTLLGREDATLCALRTVETLVNDAYEPDHGVYHLFHGAREGASVPGIFEDQIYVAKALLDAFAVSGVREYLDTAGHLLDLCIAQYWDEEGGGFLDIARERETAEEAEFLRQPRKVIEDMPTPSANAEAARALDHLWLLTGNDRYHDYARRTLEAFTGHAPDAGLFTASYGLATHFHLHPPLSVVIIGVLGDTQTQALWQVALESYLPGKIVAAFPPEAEPLPYPAGPGGQAVAYVCAGEECAGAIADPVTLREAIRTFGARDRGS